MDHYAAVWEAVAVTWTAATEEKRAHGGGLADADSGYGRADVGHCVVDCEAFVIEFAVSIYSMWYHLVSCQDGKPHLLLRIRLAS